MKAKFEGWDERDHLPDILIKIASAKTSLTRQFGGFNEEINQQLRRDLTDLYRALATKIGNEAQRLLATIPALETNFLLKLAYLDRIVSFESEDAAFAPFLQRIVGLADLKRAYPDSRRPIAQLDSDLRPWHKSTRVQLTNPSKMDRQWHACESSW